MEDFIKLGEHTLVRIDAIQEVAIIKGVLHVITEDNHYEVEGTLDEVEAGFEQVMQYLNIVEELV